MGKSQDAKKDEKKKPAKSAKEKKDAKKLKKVRLHPFRQKSGPVHFFVVPDCRLPGF